jgi:hypothetical protein
MRLLNFFSGSYNCFIFRHISLIVILSVLIFGCGPRPPKVDHVKVDFKLIPFYEDLFSIHPDSLEKEKDRLITDYGKYLEAYSMRVIGSGSPYEAGFVPKMAAFLAYEPNREVLDTCLEVFDDLTGMTDELDNAFRYYKYYFPKAEIPDVYLHISGFNQSIIVDSGWVSVSVEKYLGADCVFYEWLNIPVYQRSRMIPEKVVPDVMKAIAMTNFLYNDSVDDFVSQMLYKGMIQYYMKQVMPHQSEEILFDYTTKELDWCKHYEEMMWSTIIERKHLFSTERLMVQKYVGESPFSFYFGQESPGRTGVFVGSRIVESFMKKNPDVTLSELMNLRDYHWILSKAGYRP